MVGNSGSDDNPVGAVVDKSFIVGWADWSWTTNGGGCSNTVAGASSNQGLDFGGILVLKIKCCQYAFDSKLGSIFPYFCSKLSIISLFLLGDKTATWTIDESFSAKICLNST